MRFPDGGLWCFWVPGLQRATVVPRSICAGRLGERGSKKVQFFAHFDLLEFSFQAQRPVSWDDPWRALRWRLRQTASGATAMGRYGHLSIEEREDIMCLRREGAGVGDTACAIGRDKPTASREPRRNACRAGTPPPVLPRLDRAAPLRGGAATGRGRSTTPRSGPSSRAGSWRTGGRPSRWPAGSGPRRAGAASRRRPSTGRSTAVGSTRPRCVGRGAGCAGACATAGSGTTGAASGSAGGSA